MKIQALRQKHATLCDQQTAIVNTAVEEGRALTAEENQALEGLQTQIDGMAATIKEAERVEARNRELDKPVDKPWRPSDVVPGAPSQNNLKKDDGGFQSLGEMLHAVRFGDKKGRISNLSTADAGILIPPAFSDQILMLNPEAEIVMPRANFIPAGDPPDGEFSVPYFQQGAEGALGGISLSWTAETQEKPDVGTPKLPHLTLKPWEVSGLAPITNKTLNNWQASGAFIQDLMQKAFVSGRDFKFLRGSGAGCPLGVLANDNQGAIRVKRKTTGTVKYADVAAVMGRFYPEALEGAVWLASITNMPTLMQLTDDAGNLIFMGGDATKGLPATLGGLPIRFTGKTPTVGNEGDLVLVNFRYYLIKPGSGPFVALSEHVNFKSNETVFRIVANIDGQPWVKDPLKLSDGETTVSPYVILK